MLTGGKVVIPIACRGVGLQGGNACSLLMGRVKRR